MPITQETFQEIQNLLNGNQYLPAEYGSFLLKWLAFNRAYNDLETDRWERNRVINFARRFENHWDEIEHLAMEMASLECIGGKRVNSSDILEPDTHIKSATHYLRLIFELDKDIDAANCHFKGCKRIEKIQLCNGIPTYPWDMGKMSALMQLVYQVRCSLVHGEKRLADQNDQIERDRNLVRLSSQIMTPFLHWVLDDIPIG
ncbi:hypothetical protein ACFLV7_08530 [Chloroflexota bacterium]